MRFGQLTAAESGAFHLSQQPGHRAIPIDLHGTLGNSQVLAGFWFWLCQHKLVLTSFRMSEKLGLASLGFYACKRPLDLVFATPRRMRKQRQTSVCRTV